MISTIIVVLFMTFSIINVHGMENYYNQCLTIKQYLEYDKNEFCEMVYNKQLDPVQELTRIEQQFAYHKNKLNKERDASLLQLKSFHNISDTVWSEGMKNLECIKTDVKNHINMVLPDAMHDSIISGENKILFARHLKKYDLDIKKICIERRDASGDELESFLCVEEEKNNKFTVIFDKPVIRISSTQWSQMSPIHQKASLLQLAWLAGNMCTISSAFTSFIVENSNKGYSFDTIQSSKDFRLFFELEHNKFVNNVLCLEDYESCQCIEDLRSVFINFYTEFDRHRENFQEICTIKNLWEKRKILEEFIQSIKGVQ